MQKEQPVLKKQSLNPILPLWEYIPDGEPHVFGDRVYLFGSHDLENGDTYCIQDYVFWSAPISDLSNWSNKGINYSAKQDPLYSDFMKYMFAPDVVRGNDGRFYLYYCMSDYQGKNGYGQPISVAVCDTPDGRYEYLGFVKYPDGSPMLKYVTFDPGLINDDGTIRLYYGTWHPFHERRHLFHQPIYRKESRLFHKSIQEIRSCPGGVMGANHVELEDDMLTIKTEPCHILPTRVRGTGFEKHPFFEASSIRKIGNLYYFIYSSTNGHELCYATSLYPDRDFIFGGTIVSNGDIGYQGRQPKDRLNATGTNHGSIEQINGQWYIFYHRNTNRSAFSRQACAERITFLPDGSIPQVEITSHGLNDGPLLTDRSYPAAICCNLTNGRMPHQGCGFIREEVPCIAYSDDDRIVIATNGTTVTYKYFAFTGNERAVILTLAVREPGTLDLLSDETLIGTLSLSPHAGYETVRIPIKPVTGTSALSFYYQGKNPVRIKEFLFETV